MNVGSQRLAAEKLEEIKKLEKSIAAANGGDDMLAQLVQKRPLVLTLNCSRAVNRRRRKERRIARRKCDVCQRADPVSSPRFLLCAGCGKRRYCSELPEIGLARNGHKATCALVSEFECRVTPDCPVSERDYCDWCAETFCMDCEVGRIAPCANCGRFSCGSMKEHSYGPAALALL